MPALEEFEKLVLKRGCPVKALLLDQSFSAGVGNWVAGMYVPARHLRSVLCAGVRCSMTFHHMSDEILYHSRIHPERRCKSLAHDEVVVLHQKIREVCEFAVSVNADDSKFPENWLFQHRWVCERWCFSLHFLLIARHREREKRNIPYYW